MMDLLLWLLCIVCLPGKFLDDWYAMKFGDVLRGDILNLSIMMVFTATTSIYAWTDLFK